MALHDALMPADGARERPSATRPAAPPAGRVAHVVRSFGEISETFISDGLLAAERAGWEAWLVASRVSRPDLYAYPPPERIATGAAPGRARTALDRALLRSSAERRSAWLEPAIAAARPDVVHAHFGWGAADARLAARRLALPLVATFRGTDLTVHPGARRLHWDYRRLFRELRAAVCISAFLADRLRDLGHRGPIEVIPTGIHLERFPFRPPATEGDGTRLLFVGRQVPVKGLDVLLRAVATAARTDAGLTLDVVGDGPERPANEALARELGIERRVRFHGALRREAVVAAMRDADLFVMCSRTLPNGQAEGLGNVQKEAMAMGLPVIATRCGGIPETIPPSQRDDLVPEGDAAALADRIVALAADRASWPARAGAARAWIEETFAWSVLGERLAAVYADATTGGRR